MTLKIAPGLELPDDFVTMASAILARRGAGKTYTGSVIVEEVIAAHLPVVVLDPTGAWWGLRSSADGKKAGLSVVILGGEHGDVALDRSSGKEIAEVIVEHPGAYILDLSGFESNAAQDGFVTDFLERLYRVKAKHRDALLVVVDEADSFAPQRAAAGLELRMLGAMEAIVRRGRIRGIGVLLITQRAAVLNKNVLTQIELLFAMHTTSPQDRSAIGDWVEANATKEELKAIAGTLATLGKGDAWVWWPSDDPPLLKRVHVRMRRTFDSSKTPEAGAAAIVPTARAKIDIAALGERIARAVETSKANDPATLRARIAALEAEARNVKPPAPGPTERVVEIETIPVFRPEDLDSLTATWVYASGALTDASDRLDEAVSVVEKLAEMVRVVREELGRDQSLAGRLKANPDFEGHRRPKAPPMPRLSVQTDIALAEDVHSYAPIGVDRAKKPDRTVSVTSVGGEALGQIDLALLNVLAQFPVRTQSQLAVLAGYRISGSLFGSVAKLKRLGLIEGTSSALRITPDGREAAGPVQPIGDPRTYWSGKLAKIEWSLLEALLDRGPMSQSELAEVTDYRVSGSLFGAVAKLKKLDLIEGTSSQLRATEGLFA